MKTIVAPATPETIARAVEIIRAGGLVAFPTETVYGLGANALDANAVARIYAAKQRALNDPLIVHVATPSPNPSRSTGGETDALRADGVVGELSDIQLKLVQQLSNCFWPGPLTLVLPRGVNVPANVSAGLDTVAVRMPDHPIAQALIQASGVPIAAPSANRFGHVSPTIAQHVLDDLDGRIDMLLDGGPTRIGVESTVLDLTSDPPCVLRPGGITRKQLADSLNLELEFGANANSNSKLKLSSPGMLDKHYAPNAQLVICRDIDNLLAHGSRLTAHGSRVGVLLLSSQRAACEMMHPQFVLGESVSDIARNLYAGLRALDSAGVDVILMTDVPRDGIGEAIADRLKRAAAK